MVSDLILIALICNIHQPKEIYDVYNQCFKSVIGIPATDSVRAIRLFVCESPTQSSSSIIENVSSLSQFIQNVT